MSMVDEIFKRVTFDEHDREIHQLAREAIRIIAETMDNTAPDCAEKILAFRALHVALMHYGSALSKKDKYKTA